MIVTPSRQIRRMKNLSLMGPPFCSCRRAESLLKYARNLQRLQEADRIAIPGDGPRRDSSQWIAR